MKRIIQGVIIVAICRGFWEIVLPLTGIYIARPPKPQPKPQRKVQPDPGMANDAQLAEYDLIKLMILQAGSLAELEFCFRRMGGFQDFYSGYMAEYLVTQMINAYEAKKAQLMAFKDYELMFEYKHLN